MHGVILDRPLRLAFVGQSTFFEACVLDTGVDPRLRAALPRVPRGADAGRCSRRWRAFDPDVVVVFRPEIIPAGAFAGLRAATVGFLTEPLPRTGAGARASHEDLERRLWELGMSTRRTSTASSPSTRSSPRPPTRPAGLALAPDPGRRPLLPAGQRPGPDGAAAVRRALDEAPRDAADARPSTASTCCTSPSASTPRAWSASWTSTGWPSTCTTSPTRASRTASACTSRRATSCSASR